MLLLGTSFMHLYLSNSDKERAVPLWMALFKYKRLITLTSGEENLVRVKFILSYLMLQFWTFGHSMVPYVICKR